MRRQATGQIGGNTINRAQTGHRIRCLPEQVLVADRQRGKSWRRHVIVEQRNRGRVLVDGNRLAQVGLQRLLANRRRVQIEEWRQEVENGYVFGRDVGSLCLCRQRVLTDGKGNGECEFLESAKKDKSSHATFSKIFSLAHPGAGQH